MNDDSRDRFRDLWGHAPWDDDRWAALSEADTQGTLLEARERKFLDEYVPRRPELKAERSLRLALRSFGDDVEGEDLPARAEDDMVTGTLEMFFDEDAPTTGLAMTPDEETSGRVLALSPRRLRTVGLAGAGALAAAAAIAMFMNGPVTVEPTSHAPLGVRTASPAPPASIAWSMSSGSLAGDSLIETGARETKAFTAGPDGACLTGDDGTRACLRAGTEAKIDDGVLDVQTGAAEVEAAKVAYISLQAAGMRVEAHEGKVLIEVDAHDAWRITVQDGEVSVYDLEGKVAQLRAGDVMARGGVTVSKDEPAHRGDDDGAGSAEDAAAPTKADGETTGSSPKRAKPHDGRAKADAPGQTASEMLAAARKLRAAGKPKEAARAYEALLRRHPAASASQTATVALGQLYLGPLGQPQKALTAFDRYIRGGGKTLAEEARYGKIRALQAQGRTGEANREIERFVAAYPNSSYAKALE